jgi:phosphotransferase system HPr (HPr) family protein
VLPFTLDLLPIILLGAVLGLDVVSFPQAMISRPIVAATLAGAFAGSPAAGLVVGVALECLALETLPFGASRYPEWGSASVVGGLIGTRGADGALLPDPGAWVIGVMAAIATAWVGGWTMVQHRTLIARWARPRLEQLAAGSMRTVVSLQVYGLTADLVRGGALTLLGLWVAWPVSTWAIAAWRLGAVETRGALILGAAAVAASAVWKVLHGYSVTRRLFVAGLAVGTLLGVRPCSCAASPSRARGTTRSWSATAWGSASSRRCGACRAGSTDSLSEDAGPAVRVFQCAPVSGRAGHGRPRAGRARTGAAHPHRAVPHRALRTAGKPRRPAGVGRLAAGLLAGGLLLFGFGWSPLGVVAGFLLLYNVGHLGLRDWGLRAGWRKHGLRVATAMGHPVLQHGPRYIGRVSAVLGGLALPLAVHRAIGGAGAARAHSDRRGGCHSAAGSAPRAIAGPCRGVARRPAVARGLRPLLGGPLMAERSVQIVNKHGLHARPAAEMVKAASKFKSDITISRDDLEVNGKSIMGVMMLAAEYGASITLRGHRARCRRRARRAVGAGRVPRFGES